MSIGMNITYRDNATSELYWPYLTQRHLRDFVWPIAKSLGLERIELIEVICRYQLLEQMNLLLRELEALHEAINRESIYQAYSWSEHVQGRTKELIERVTLAISEWHLILEVSFF